MTRITGQAYLALMQDPVFDPLQMTTTAVDDAGRPSASMAKFYRLRADGQLRPWRNVDLNLKWPGGGLLSNSSDLARLGSASLDDNFIKPSVRGPPQQRAFRRIPPPCY